MFPGRQKPVFFFSLLSSDRVCLLKVWRGWHLCGVWRGEGGGRESWKAGVGGGS